MDAVTYPIPAVVSVLQEGFECVKLNTQSLDAAGRQFVHQYRLLWEPGFVIFSHRSVELHRAIGAMVPEDFIATLNLGRGKCAIATGQLADAVRCFTRAAECAASPDLAAEALYWRGIAVFRHEKGGKARLQAEWEVLRERFPQNRWWKAANVFARSEVKDRSVD